MAYLAVRHDAEFDVYFSSAVFGLGVGLAYAAMPAYINGAVPAEQSGIANGMNAVLRTVGGAVGTAVMAAILTGDTLKLPIPVQLPTLDAYQHAFWVAGVMCLVAAVVPFGIRRIKAAATPSEQPAPALAKTDA